MQKILGNILREHECAISLFDRLNAEYLAASQAGKYELFLAVVGELVTAQAAAQAIARLTPRTAPAG